VGQATAQRTTVDRGRRLRRPVEGVVLPPVACLFVRTDSVYKDLPACECYDIERDALTFGGGMPVVAHPPCRTWGKLKAFAKAPQGEHEFALWAVDQVRREGGVLEHPFGSQLWRAAMLPEPGWLPDEWGGYTVQVDQFHWGHLARKRTWLYICGCDIRDLPPMPRREGEPTHAVSSFCGRRVSREVRRALPTYRPELGPQRRNLTPPTFAEWLVTVARLSCRQNAHLTGPNGPGGSHD